MLSVISSVAAGVHSFYFPKNRSYFNKYNLFKGISKREKRIWQRDYTFTLKALSKMSDNKKVIVEKPKQHRVSNNYLSYILMLNLYSFIVIHIRFIYQQNICTELCSGSAITRNNE